jgi:hypothetical protein
MAKNSIYIFDDGTYVPGSKRFAVAASTAGASINPGELVYKAKAATSCRAFAQSGIATALKPSVTSDFIAGLATSTSTETTAAAGIVDVIPVVPGLTFICAPTVAATWDTQAEYNALVGSRVLLNIATTGVWTVLASDSANNGLVVEPLDVVKHPGQVRFSVRQALMYSN